MTLASPLTTLDMIDFYLDGTTTKEALRRITWQDPKVILPWQTRSPHAMPTVTDGMYMDCPWNNLQALDAAGPDGNGFDTSAGDARIREDGLWLFDEARLLSSGGDYQIGLRYYWQEGIVRLDQPLGSLIANLTLGFDNHANQNHQTSILQTDDFAMHARWMTRMWNGASLTTWNWIDVDSGTPDAWKIPIGTNVPGVAEYCYFSYRRTYDGAGTGTQTLYVEHKNGAALLAADIATGFAFAPNDPGTDPAFGDITTNDRLWRVLWWRAASSDTTHTPSVAETTWTGAKVYETLIANSSGDDANTVLDAGSNDQYWNRPRFLLQYDQDGSQVHGRFAAANSVPTGDLSGQFSGDWVLLNPVTHPTPGGYLLGGGPQGRYLMIQLRFTPSGSVSLQGASSRALASSVGGDECFLAEYQSTPWPTATVVADPVPIEVQGPAPSQSEFPFTPHYVGIVESRFAGERLECEGNYAQTYARATVATRTFELGWTLPKLDYLVLRYWLQSESATDGVFDFTAPDGTTVSGALVTDSIQIAELGGAVVRVTLQVEEVAQ